jgi:hypothetical protein
MTDYRIEAATKEEWAERALRAEAALADGSFYQEKDIDALQNRIEELKAKLATCEKYKAAYAECDRIGTQAVRDLEAKLEKAVEVLGHWRLASAGYVSVQSAIDKHDATLAELKGEDRG